MAGKGVEPLTRGFQANLRAHCDRYGLRRDYERERAYAVSHQPRSLKIDTSHGEIDRTFGGSGYVGYSTKGAAAKAFNGLTKRQWASLTDDERYALYDYTCGSGPINRPLRGYDGTWDNFVGIGNVDLDNEGHGKTIADMTSGLRKCRLDHNAVLYRGSSEDSLALLLGDKSGTISSVLRHGDKAAFENLGNAYSGRTVTDNGFFSTSADRTSGFLNKPVTYEVMAPKGTEGMYVEPFSAYGRNNTDGTWDGMSLNGKIGPENEFLLQRDTSFKVWSITLDGGKIRVVLEVIRQVL